MKKHTFGFGILLLMAINTLAQSVVLDNTFNGTGSFLRDFGFQDNLNDVKVQSDGKIVTVGTALTPSFSGRLLVVKQKDDGTPDSTFNNTGVVLVEDFNESYAYESFTKNDGSIVVAGTRADGAFQFATLVMRFNADGTRDSTFGTNGVAEIELSAGDDFAYAMTELSDHKILLAGTAIDTGFRNAPVVTRLLENGSIDSTFGVNGTAVIPIEEIDNRLNSIALQNDGKIVVSGHYGRPLTLTGQFNMDVLVARFHPNGTIDSTFGINGLVTTKVFADSVDYAESVYGMQLTTDGGIVVTGYTTLEDFGFDVLMLKYDSTGTLVTDFGENGIVVWGRAAQDIALDVKEDANGKLLICGSSGGFFFDDRDLLLMRYNSNGTIDSTYNTNGIVLTDFTTTPDEANAMALQTDGKIVVAGKTNNGDNNDIAIVRYKFGTPSAITQTAKRITKVYPNPVSSMQALWIELEEPPLHYSAEIYCADGTLVNTAPLQTAGQRIFMQMPPMVTPGIYFLKIGNTIYKVAIE